MISFSLLMTAALLLTACSKPEQIKTLTFTSFTATLSFPCDDIDYSGTLEYTACDQIKFTVERPENLKGITVEQANGERLAKMGDAYISLDKAERLFENSSCFTELFEVLGAMGSKTFELKDGNTISVTYSNGDFSVRIARNLNVPEYIETEDYKFVFDSTGSLNV